MMYGIWLAGINDWHRKGGHIATFRTLQGARAAMARLYGRSAEHIHESIAYVSGV